MSRKITKLAVEAFLAHESFCLGNTRVTQDMENSYLVLHGNGIARKYKQTGSLEITTAGWNTVTTRERLNGLPGVQVYTKAGQLYLNGIAWSGDWKTV